MQGKTVVLTRTYMRTCIMLFQVPSLNEGTGQVKLELAATSYSGVVLWGRT